ncbi:anthranilate phosphoribosyltransferase [Rhodoblastus acidophilus]|uniref:Anthranilate phosphoribosyltransferase n=1 Tax=Candidatus Rhodoblastus alkanivorans TaxID=2954117 RepID=A0ABS9Z9K0_9HYPH|nr:anthranilate phosphoribosyltransferase [Candidatus Rhodoblastus alkanivorans]MCI4679551.1 anthranilate phosphoribosyltransferase [Candidatus Rhodoblastus alkanivorans]MCI4683302.1 anthranilate phosphoribosyltransferase [Candidatus Rhodoblastus alkanivorans]MDI4640615.1 anthranilate phosphoribosyltransferase [Rhodoblastus acidophilus]
MDAFKPFLAKLASGARLSREEAEAAFDLLLSGQSTPAQTGAFLMGLRARGETLDEMTGAVATMRAKMLKVQAPEGAIDIVGTGGDGAQTYNISTLASLIVAACGVPVAKHGNRAASSLSGASDVLSELGVRIGIAPNIIERSLREAQIGFMTAQAHHAAMAHVAPVRRELGARTLFNLLGPLSNPAGVRRALIGVFSESWMEPIAQVLDALGAEVVWIVHGSDGLDEVTTTGPTKVLALEHGALRRFEITPEEVGVKHATLNDLRGGDPAHNAAALRAVLDGARNAYRDIAALNAAAALVVAGKAADLATGFRLAGEALDSGRARATLENLIRISNEDENPSTQPAK